MRTSPLLRKALAVLVVVFGVATTATAISTAWRINEIMTTQYQSKGKAIANSLADTSLEILLNRDLSTVQATIDQSREIEGVAYVFVVDGSGTVIAHTFEPGVPEELLQLKDDEPAANRRLEIAGKGEFIDVAAPMLAGKAGYVHVGMNRGDIRSAIWLAIRSEVVLLFLIFLLSVLAAYSLMEKIVQPLNRLTRYANTLAAGPVAGDGRPGGELAPIAARSDEVGQLAQAFRHMVGELSAREGELRKAHDELEGRVRERTAELQQTNERLHQEVAVRKRAEENLACQARELARSNAELEQFAYVASHDLQEPLRMVSSYTTLLAERYRDQLDEKAHRWIEYAVGGVARMRGLIEDLLAYSRVSRLGKAAAPTDSTAVLRQALANLDQAIQEAGATVTHDPLPQVLYDPTQLLQLFQNLIGNALKFRGAEPPHIHVAAEAKEGEWVFSVRDNGIGLDMQHAERIFVIFQRLHGRGNYPGTGIGLAICKRIVEHHGGRIWVESQPGRGATFSFTTPKRGANHGHNDPVQTG